MRTTLKRGTVHGDRNGVPVFPPSPLTPVTRYGPRRRSRLHLLGRILLWTFVFCFVLVGGAAGGWVLWVKEEFSGTRAHSRQAKEAEGILDDVPPADQPAVALVIGHDRRFTGPAKGAPSRSDTIMLVRADPRLRAISMLSFPRDLVVTIPACRDFPERVARINEAFTECGPKGTIQTVKRLTGVPINYFITVDFRGFMDIVEALGGVYIDVDRRYFNDNEGLGPGETYERIDLHPGYQRLNGRDALDFVRYRHTDSDFYRNARQQQFVKAVKQQVSTFWSVPKLPGIVKAITRNVEVGVGGGGALDFKTMYSYAKLIYDLPSGNVQQARIEGVTSNADFELSASEGEIEQAVEKLMNPDVRAAEKAATVATGRRARSRDTVAPSSVTVKVQNGNGSVGAAEEAASLLARRGYKATNGGNADRQDHFETIVRYNAAARDGRTAADQVANLFGDAEVRAAPPGLDLAATLQVVVGKTFTGKLAPGPADETPSHRPPTVTRDATLAPVLARAQRKVDFQLLVPTLRDASSKLADDEPVRVYDLSGEDAVRIVFNGPQATDYWGIQETSWTEAPMLDGPSVTRTIAGREYRLFFTGPKLHVVAFEENGAVYWVSNTLLDGLSNETMLAIARGLKPVRL
ncbi:MAG: LCP family protein [Actinomycetota bacterium]|nr:LCP family protein [Actinomycetota bacterium]